MIVENVEALKSWLAKLLEPICEADPSALSSYVIALVKKDKPEEDLKALCTDQLDVFLQKETDSFVDKLFESLTTKSYLGTPVKEVLTKDTSKLYGGKYVGAEEEVGHVDVKSDGGRNRSPLRVHSDCNGSRTREDRRTDERKRRGEDRFRKRAELRRERRDCAANPASPTSPANRTRSRMRSSSRSRSCSRIRNCGHIRSSSRMRSSSRNRSCSRIRNCSHIRSSSRMRCRSRNKSCSRMRSRSRIRSCSRMRSRSRIRSCDRMRSQSHNRSCRHNRSCSRNRSCRRNRSCGRSRSRSRGRTRSGDGGSWRGRERRPKLDEQRKDPEGSAPAPGSSCDPPQQRRRPRPQCPPCSGGPVTPSSVAVAMPAHLPDSTTESWLGPCSDRGEDKSLHKGAALKQRCHDYSDKGFGVHGDLCPCDHGNDPSAVDDVTLPAEMPFPPPPAANVAPRTEPNVTAAHDDGSWWSGEQESRKWPLGANQGPLPKKPWMDTLILNNQHKLTIQKKSHYGNTKLEVCKIPRDLNNITKLNEHFSAFGTIVNIQVAFGGDPEAALIRYASTGEARRAVSSTEAVLKNRFIQVRWHRDGREQEPRGPPGQSYSAPSGPPHANVHKTTTASVYLQKTAYSSSIMKSTPKTVGKVARAFEAQKAMKKKQEALKLQQDMTRVKQRMLEKQIECQKVLINRLERTRAVGPRERAQIVRTLKELSEKIGRLKEAVRSASVSTAGSAGPGREMPTQKELLGAELDVQKRLISGDDSTDLKKKLGQFQVEAARLGLVPAGGKVSSTQDRGRGRGRGVGGRGRGMGDRGGGGHLVVDHRPQTPTVLGVTNEEEKELRPHFVKFGDIEEVQENNTAMTFRTQGDVEIGENQGEKFKAQTLQITCYTPEVASEPMNPKEDTSKEEPVSSVLLPDEDDEGEDDDEDDEDEEDEHESRSWRR